MKNTLIIIAIFALFISCKKSNDGAKNPIGYSVEVKVADGVNFTLELSGNTPVPHNASPNLKNASTTTSKAYKPGSSAFLRVKTTDFFKDENIEVILRRSSSNEIIFQTVGKKEIFHSWNVN